MEESGIVEQPIADISVSAAPEGVAHATTSPGEPSIGSTDVQQQMPLRVADERIDDPRVAAAIQRLEDLEDLPVHEHVAVFTDVQSRLTEALSSVGDTE